METCRLSLAISTALITMLFSNITFASVTELGDNIALAVPLSADTVLCSDAEHNLVLLNLPGGEHTPWLGVWDYQAEGWIEDGHIATLCASPDLEWVCYSVGVGLPETEAIDYEGMRWALAVVLARADGSESKCVALSIEVGGGPEFAFTQDSKRLVGSPMLQCEPTPEEYAFHINREPKAEYAPIFNCIDVESWQPDLIPNLDIGDGFWKCPYSDYYRIENNWYAEHNFSCFATGGVTGSWATPDGMDCRVYGWVLPDAMLAESGGKTGLLLATGGIQLAPRYGLQVYCWLPDNTYLLREKEGGPMLHAWMDWERWLVVAAQLVPDYPDIAWAMLTPLPDSSGVLINEWGPSKLQLLTFD